MKKQQDFQKQKRVKIPSIDKLLSTYAVHNSQGTSLTEVGFALLNICVFPMRRKLSLRGFSLPAMLATSVALERRTRSNMSAWLWRSSLQRCARQPQYC